MYDGRLKPKLIVCVLLLQTFMANAAVFTRWTIERQRMLDSGHTGKPDLSASDWKSTQGLVNSSANVTHDFDFDFARRHSEGCRGRFQSCLCRLTGIRRSRGTTKAIRLGRVARAVVTGRTNSR